MKIAIAGGHSKKAPGASKYIDEYKCDRAVVKELAKVLKAAGHTVVDCSNEKPDQNSELAEEVRLANDSKADLFVAVHFNAGGGTGSEAYTYAGSNSKLAKDVCKKSSANIAKALGIRDRGAKTATFYVLRKTTMPAVLVEVCFVDTKGDADAYKKAGAAKVAKAIAEAIGGKASAPAETKPADPAPEKPGKPATSVSKSVPKGKYAIQVNGLRIRESANGPIVPNVRYDKGDTVYLDGTSKVVAGKVWGRYTGKSGKFRWIGVREADGSKTYARKI